MTEENQSAVKTDNVISSSVTEDRINAEDAYWMTKEDCEDAISQIQKLFEETIGVSVNARRVFGRELAFSGALIILSTIKSDLEDEMEEFPKMVVL